MSPLQPRPLFVYGTLRAMPLLAWALTGDARKTNEVVPIARDATVMGYSSQVDGYLLHLETMSQRRKLDDFEGEAYSATPVSARVVDVNGHSQVVDADMYVWTGDMDEVSELPWSLDVFVKERLDDWIELFAGMELVGEDE
ncbi:hypothetical protein GGX14DRAFT_557638 [Mycena pura]|uniref:Putative gamma-glutamylcyclotransferase n=1 Tax=Mycena pura TaxID=153505 RepID=A0AAD7E0P7_9AGAR|nr:hypothetical protein GGX14DRAFT_557638 [Mycena pura]